MGILDFIKRPWTLAGVTRPWPAGESIHDYLVAHTKDGVLDDPERPLPGTALDGLHWAPGARDGILAHHGGLEGASTEELDGMVRALSALFREATAPHLDAVYTECKKGQVAGLIDRLADALNEVPDLDAVRVHELGKVLATEAPHVEAVKLGISLLGLVEHDDRAILVPLALHEELTMFASLAIVKQLDAFEPVLFELAKRVHGWGRIHTVERLADTTSKPIKAWLLREGFRNTVLDAYLAYLAATTGELHRALAKPDAALLEGAAGLFEALAEGGPTLDLADYTHAPEALGAWLPLVTPTLAEVAALDALAERPEIPAPLRPRLEALRMSDAALAAIATGLQSLDNDTFARADAAAKRRQLPTFALHEARVLAKTDVTYSVLRLMQEATPTTIDRALAAASSVVDLDEAEQRLAFVLQELPRFATGTGAEFVIAALRSELEAARTLAARVLGVWGSARRSHELTEALEEAAEREDDDEVKAGFERVLAGQTFDPPPPVLH